jgi:hypothetical protein
MANYRVSTNTNNSNEIIHDKTNNKNYNKKDNKTKNESPNAFTLKYDLLKISIDLQTAFAAETHFAERQWLKEQLNVLKLLIF